METALLSLGALLLGLLLLSHWVTFLQVTRQQGRLLLRLEGLEHGVAELLRLAGGANAHERASGLPVEAPFPPFTLPDLDGNRVSLAEYPGQRALLVHWSPACGFCDLIAPDLAALEAELAARKVTLLLISREDAAANRKLAEAHGLRCPILLQDETNVVESFRSQGTPVAYLVDEAGRVATPLAEGTDEVLLLARRMASEEPRLRLPGERPLSESRIERNGLKAGALAPLFRLPDLLTDREVALATFRGRQVLLVFTDPQCGPCDQLLPFLNRLHEEGAPDLSVIVVGRGEPTENRRKVDEYHARFPLVLQNRWELSRQYGIFATPVAFLIGRDGLLARDVAQGQPEILALAASASVACERVGR